MEISKSANVSSQNSTTSCAISENDLDLQLVARIQAGDPTAFDPIVKKYRERLYSFIYNMTSNHEDASELTQDTFIKAFSSIHTFKLKSSFFTWLYRIAANTTFSFLKKAKWKRFFSFNTLDDESSFESLPWLEPLVDKLKTDKSLLIKELQEKINEAIQSLSPEHRMVIVLFEIDNLSHSEIAELMNTSEGTVRSRLHYAKSQLQSLLKEYIS